jgi:hypothetical protein
LPATFSFGTVEAIVAVQAPVFALRGWAGNLDIFTGERASLQHAAHSVLQCSPGRPRCKNKAESYGGYFHKDRFYKNASAFRHLSPTWNWTLSTHCVPLVIAFCRLSTKREDSRVVFRVRDKTLALITGKLYTRNLKTGEEWNRSQVTVEGFVAKR